MLKRSEATTKSATKLLLNGLSLSHVTAERTTKLLKVLQAYFTEKNRENPLLKVLLTTTTTRITSMSEERREPA